AVPDYKREKRKITRLQQNIKDYEREKAKSYSPSTKHKREMRKITRLQQTVKDKINNLQEDIDSQKDRIRLRETINIRIE
ncbi:15003_t:CDS:1, partial [Gigaspora rosea]